MISHVAAMTPYDKIFGRLIPVIPVKVMNGNTLRRAALLTLIASRLANPLPIFCL